MSSFTSLLAKWSDDSYRHGQKECVSLEKQVQPGATGATEGQKLTKNTLVAPVAPSCTTFFTKPVLFQAPAPSLLWWRDSEAIRCRFDEIAAIAEFDNNADRDAAERIARDCVAGELRHAGLAEGAIRSAIKNLMGCST